MEEVGGSEVADEAQPEMRRDKKRAEQAVATAATERLGGREAGVEEGAFPGRSGIDGEW